MSQKKEEIIFEIRANYQKAIVDIGRYQQEVEDLKNEQKEYNAAVKAGTMDKDKYRKAMDETNAAIKYNQENVRILNKELQNNLKYDKSATDSMVAMKARLSNLNAEYDRLGNSLADVEKKNLLGKEIKAITSALSDEEKALGNFHRQVGNYGVATKSIQQSIRAELKMLTEQIGKMKLAGKENSDEYIALVKRASEVKDAFGDAAREINVGASDTKGLDRMKGAVDVLAGSFTMFNSVQGVFTEDQKVMSDIIQRVQIGIGALSAAIALQNALQKEGAVMDFVRTVQSKAKTLAMAMETKGTIGATVAQRMFNTVAKANPYVLLATALITVIGALALFSIGAESAADKQKKLNAATKAYNDYLDFTNSKIEEVHAAKIKAAETDLALAKAQGKSADEIEAMEDAIFAAKMNRHAALEKNNESAIRDIDKNKSKLQELQEELFRLEMMLASGKARAVKIEVDGKKIVMDVKDALDLTQAEIEKTNHSIAIGVKIKTEKEDDVNTEMIKDAEKAAEAAKEQREKYAEAVKEQKEKEKEAIRQAEDSVLALLKDGCDKQSREIQTRYAREIADLQTKIDTEKNLTVKAKEELRTVVSNLKQQEIDELAKLSDTFSEEQFRKDVEIRRMQIETQLMYVKDGTEKEHQLKLDNIELSLQAELEANRTKDEALRIDEGLIKDKYNAMKLQQIDDFNRQARDKQAEEMRLMAENTIMQLELDGQSTLQRKLELKRAEIEALAQLDGESDAAFSNRKLTLQEQEKQIIKETADTKRQETDNMLTAVGGAFGAMSQMMGNMAEDNEALAAFSKVLALFEIGVNTAKAISSAIATATKTGATVWDMIAGIAIGVAAVIGAMVQATSLLNKQKEPKKPKMNKYATGGLISGEGSGTSDSILARVSNGESIMTQMATQMFSPILSSFNQIGGGIPIQVVNTSAQVMGEEMLARAFAKGAAALPPPVVSVEEISNVTKRVEVIESLRNVG